MAKCIFLTGMSGTGKSTTIRALAARGYRTVDMDDPGWSEIGPDGDWRWREARLQALLASLGRDDVLFLSGCAENQVKFYDHFAKIILLSVPTPVLVERLQTRTTNTYGKDPAELAETLGYLETVEPLLRQRADLEIDTRAPLEQVVQTLVGLLDD
ncbi:MAG: AAA family ATPase [Candidatus Promineifilaceae bacterium]|nr:AAA family ATPase [Candidatus Promineifilaceae bacterium]